ncbi:hypothetical protein [Vogesella urethralis]|jgi:hypothetical protein|uniref:hypothetical protein n=1 Tax=Vogesella urethralis TaxID=2592656 RepID=UPI0011868B5D|nr:hypothetical protein [Vogesella urethralis]
MHTLLVILGGILLLVLCQLLARISGIVNQASAALLFIPLWLLLAASNMVAGVQHAGYTVAEEWPVFLLVFSVPALPALWLWQQLRR